jgi:hypothetical protein
MPAGSEAVCVADASAMASGGVATPDIDAVDTATASEFAGVDDGSVIPEGAVFDCVKSGVGMVGRRTRLK